MNKRKDDVVGKEFGAKLKLLRENAGLSIYGLAKKANVTTEGVSKLEQGGRTPTWDTVCRLADALGVSVADFR